MPEPIKLSVIEADKLVKKFADTMYEKYKDMGQFKYGYVAGMLEGLLVNEISGNGFGAAKQMQIEIEEYLKLKTISNG